MLIASRDLTYVEADGNPIPIPIRLFAPQDAGRGWRCRYTIGWPSGADESAGHGVDRAQAILLTLQMIGTRIYASDYHRSGRLRFEEFGRGYGFPVPKNARDLLVGDDNIFDG